MSSLISIYQLLKPARTILLTSIGIQPHSCRHTPSCSQYAKNALHRYGTIRGSLFALKRFLNCRPTTFQ